MAMSPKRQWQDQGAPEIVTPELDSNNLPVVEDPIINKGFIPLRRRNISHDVSQTASKRLVGAGQPFLDEENLLAGEQPLLEKFGRGLVSRGLSVAPKIGQSIGHIGGAIAYGMDYMSDPETADPNVIWDNAVANYMSNLDERLREELPIYKSYRGRNGPLLQQMGDPGFWFDDMFDSLAFLASAFATGMGAGAIVKGLGAAGKALALTKAAGPKLLQAAKVYGATILNGISEAGFEAKDFADTERNKIAYADYGTQFNLLTEDQQIEIKGKVAEGTANVFRGNLGVLIIPNYVQSRFMFGALGNTAKSIRRGVRAGKLSVADVNTFKTAAKQATLGVFTEGPWEEGMQYALQSYSGRKAAFGQNFDDYMLGVANQWVNNWETTEGQKNMMLGSIVGGIFGGFGAIRESNVKKGLISEEQATFDRLKDQLSEDDRWYIEHVKIPFKTFSHTITGVENEDGTGNAITKKYDSFYNSKGKLEIDNEIAQKMFMFGMNNKFLFDEAMVASIDGNNMHLDRVNKDALARLYYNYATNPNMTLEEAEDMLLQKELEVPRELEEAGVTGKFTREDLAPLRVAFEEAQNSLLGPEDFTETKTEAAFKVMVGKTLFGESVKREQYKNYLNNPEISSEQKEDISRLIEDSEKLTNSLKEKSTRNRLMEDFKKERQSIKDHYDNIDRINKEGGTESEILLAQYEKDEFEYINGKEEPFSTDFDYNPLIRGAELARPVGAKYNYFYDRGQTHFRKAELNDLIDAAKKDPSKVNSVVDTMAEDLRNGVRYTKEDVEKVNQLIQDKEKARVRWDREARRRQEAIDLNFGPVEMNPAFDPAKLAKDEAWMENHLRRIADLERAKSEFNESILGVDLPTDKKEMRDQVRAQRSFQRQFADKTIDQGQSILDSQVSNPDAYDDLRSVQDAIGELNKIKKVYTMPGRNRMIKTTREFRGLEERLNKVLDELKAIEDEVRDRQHNRDLQDTRSQQSYSAALFSALGIDTKTGEVTNQSLVETIKAIITEQVYNNIMEEAQNQKEFPYDSIFVEKILQRVKESKKGRQQLIKFLSDQNNQSIIEFETAYKDLEVNKIPGMGGAVSFALGAYKKNPAKAFSELIETATNRIQAPAKSVTEIDKFLRTKDVYALKIAIEEGAEVGYKAINKEELLAMLDAHLDITSTINIIDRLNSTTSYAEMIANESKAMEGKEHAPSNQQRIALREAVVAHMTPIKNADRKYAGWTYLKGLGGTGKTKLFAVYLPQLLGIKSENIIAISTHPNALSVLKDSLSDVKNVFLDTELTEEQIKDDNTEILIIDEIARLDKNSLNALATQIAVANKTRKNPLRVYAMGDPSQVIGENSEFAAINDLDVNVKEITPLTAVFRSGNTALLHIQNSFLDFPGKVTSLVGTSSAERGLPSDGVHVSTVSDDLVKQFNVHSKANKRSRAIVVSNKKLFAQYKKLGADVYMHYQVAGLEFDEVYVDINPEDFEGNRRFNQAMYTAISRSKEYSFIKSYEPVGKWRSETGKVTKEDTTERAQQIQGEYSQRLIFEAQVMGDDMKGVTITSPQRLRPTEKDKAAVAEPQTDQEAAAEEPMSSENNPPMKEFEEDMSSNPNTPHELERPSFNAVRLTEEVKIDGKTIRKGKVQEGSQVFYIRTKGKDGKPRVTIVARNHNPVDNKPDIGNTWSVIGVMTENELENTERGRYINKKLLAGTEGGQGYYNRLSKGDIGKLLSDDPKHGSILAEGVVHRARPLSYRYSAPLTSARGMLQNMMEKVRKIFSDTDHELEYSVQIFTNADVAEGEFQGNVAGVPYMVVRRKVRKDGEIITYRKEQFIRLSGRALGRNDGILSYINKIKETINLINTIPGLQYGEPKTNELIKRFKRNYEVANNEIIPKASKWYNYEMFLAERDNRGFASLTEDQFNQLEEITQQIIPLFYGVGSVKVEVESEEEFQQYLGNLLDRKDMSYSYVEHGGDRIGGYIEQEDEKGNKAFVKGDGLVAGIGKAQNALDILAKANKSAPWVVSKVMIDKQGGKSRKRYVSVAKSLFAEQSSSGGYYQHLLKYFEELSKLSGEKQTYRDFVNDREIKLNSEQAILEVEQAIALMQKDGLVVQGHTYEELQEKKARHIRNPITVETLNDILSFGEDGSHANLFYPLKIKDINDLGKVDKGLGRIPTKNINALDDLLGTKLEEILPTRIQVKIKGEIATAKSKTKGAKVKSNLSRILKDKKNWNKRTMLKGQELGEEITYAKARALLKQFIPTINEEGEDILKFVDELTLRRLAGEDAYGLYEDEAIYALDKNGTTFINVIRHESFHKIFNEHLKPIERDLIDRAYRKQFSDHKNRSRLEIEELLAQAFHNYQTNKLTGIDQVLKRFFNWLGRRLRFINLNTTNLNRFFETIESGYFVEKKYSGLGITRRMRDIRRRYGVKNGGLQAAISTYSDVRSLVEHRIYLLNKFGYQYVEREDENGNIYYDYGSPVTKDEAVEKAFENIKKAFEKIEVEYEDSLRSDSELTNDEKIDLAIIHRIYLKAIHNYRNVLKDLYENYTPRVKFIPGEIITEDSEIEIEEMVENYKKDATRVNHKNHIIESDEVNHERKINRLVKDYLSNIGYENGVMNWREAYIRSLNMLEGIQVWSEDFFTQLSRQIEMLGNHPRDRAIADALYDINEIATSGINRDGKGLRNDVKFLSDNIFIQADDSIKDIHGVNSVMNEAGGLVITRKVSDDTRQFIAHIASLTDVSTQELMDQFRQAQALTILRGIINVFNNQKQKNIFLVENKRENSVLNISYIPGSYMGIHRSLSSTINDRLRNKFKTIEDLKKWKTLWLVENTRKVSSLQDKHEFVKKFVKDMGLGSFASDLPQTGVSKLYGDILYFFERAETGENRMGRTIPSDDGDRTSDMSDVLSKERKMVNQLSKQISYSSKYMRATNVRDVKGKRKYTWSPTSNAYEILFNFVHNTVYGSGDFAMETPRHLRKKFFTDHNIFVKGINRIYDVIDNDGIKYVNNEGLPSATVLDEENIQQNLNRTFVAGFIDRLRRSPANRPTYFQFLYPNERKSAVGAEIEVLNKSQVRDALRAMIEQAKGREDKLNLADYARDKNINFRFLDKVKIKDTDKAVDQIMKLMAEEAMTLAETMVDKKIQFDKDTFTIKALEKFAKEYNEYFDKPFDLSVFSNDKYYGDSVTRNYKEGEYVWTAEQLYPLAMAYFVNDYVNSYFLNQLILGDYAQYKNAEYIMRRFSLATAPGSKPIVNEKFGMKPKARFLYLTDPVVGQEGIRERIEKLLKTDTEKAKLDILMEGFENNFDSSDGQGFMTPERFEELKYAGFNNEFQIGNVLKPVVFTIDENGNVRAIKYSSIVLSDELVSEFPSLGELRDNLRENSIDEAVFGSGMKVGTPVLKEGHKNHKKLIAGKYVTEDSEVYEVHNDDYRIQLDPRAEIESSVRQPSQILYLAGVLEHNTKQAASIYNHLRELVSMGAIKHMDRFGTRAGVRKNILSILRGYGSEREHDMIAGGLSIDFPSVTNKVTVALGAELQKNIVDLRWPGTKLVLQSGYGVAKYGNKAVDGAEALEYYRESNGQLVAEVIVPKGLLPQEYEDAIEVAMANGKHAGNYYNLPDLLGYRIPSSDIHSAIAMKVVGFYDTPNTNVIIAPDLLVALHGSDFDVDSLFVIKRSVNKEGDPIGYVKKDGKWTFNHKMQSFETIEEEIAYHKNGIMDRLLDIVSGANNIESMLAPIPLKPIREMKKYVMKLRKISSEMDLSNMNDKLKAHGNIFGAARATGIFGNAAKAISYMLRTGENDSMPVLRGDGQEIVINGKSYNKIQLNSDILNKDGTLIEDKGERITVSIDGFINAAIDNIRELALPILNITDNTINGFIALRAMGVDLKTVVDILQQPILLDYSKGGSIKVHKERIISMLGLSEVELSEIVLNEKTLGVGIKVGESLNNMNPAIVNDKRDRRAEEKLKVQLLVLNTFEQANILGRQIGELANFLNIGRTIPVEKLEIDKVISAGETIFGPVSKDGTLTAFENSTFAFDIINFFKKNPHLQEIFTTLKWHRDVIEESIKKHSPTFQKHVDDIFNSIGRFTLPVENAKELIREQFLNYLISKEVFSGEYRVDQDVVHSYMNNGIRKELTGPKAINQIFIRKVMELKDHLLKMQDGEQNPVQNKFLDHLSEVFNTHTSTRELAFEGRVNMDPMDVLDVQAAFLELNKYEVQYNKKTRKYKVIEHKEARRDNEFSDLQREFVTYGIMNWGLGFGATNYSIFLPAELYTGVDKVFNNILDKFIGQRHKTYYDRVKEDFLLQFTVNNGKVISGLNYYEDPESGERVIINAEIINTYKDKTGDVNNVYTGEENGYKFDRKFTQLEGYEFPLFMKTGFKEDRYIYVRLNDPASEAVYYAIVDKVLPFQVYHTTDSVLDNGYTVEEAYHEVYNDKPIRNFRVSDLSERTIKYNGEDVKVGDIVSLTVRHDITRVNKQYHKVKLIVDNSYSLAPVTIQTKAFESQEDKQIRIDDMVEEIVSLSLEDYRSVKSLTELIDSMIERSSSERQRTILSSLRENFIEQGLKVEFGRLPKGVYGRYRQDGSIIIDPLNIYSAKGTINNQIIDRIITHELVHGLTSIPYRENQKFKATINLIIDQYFVEDKNGKLQAKNSAISKKIIDAMPSLMNDDFRGFDNKEEFMAEILANDSFAAAMDEIYVKDLEPKKSLLRKLMDAILEFFGITRDNSERNSLSYFMVELFKSTPHRGQYRILEEVPEGYRMIDNNGNTIIVESVQFEGEPEVLDAEVIEETKTDPIRDKVNRELTKIHEDSKRIQIDKDDQGNELGTYSVENSQNKIRRISDMKGGLISFFSNRKIDIHKTFGQLKADRRWGSRDHEHKLQTDKGMETYDEFNERMEHSSLLGMIKGSIIHLFVKRHLNKLYNLGYNDIDIQKEINDMASMSEGDVMVDHHRWVEKPDNIKKIFKNMGINYYYEGDKTIKDITVLSEISVWSELLGFGGTMDVLIAHADGRYGLRDIKTGMRFGERISTDPLKYGLQDIYITDNQRERAKLQVMLYAFLLKLENPGMRFRDLQVSWLPNELLLEIEDNQKYVEIGSYLRMIQTFLKDAKGLKDAGIDENVYTKILEKSPKIFDVSEYTDKSSDTLWKELVNNNVTPEEALRRRYEEMTIILGRIKSQSKVRIEELPKKDRLRLSTLTKEILIMRSDPSMQLDVFPGKDIGKLTEWLGNYSDVNMDEFQVWKKLRDEPWNKYTQLHDKELRYMMKLTDPVYDEYMKGKLRLRFGGQDRIANVNYAELFSFAFKEVQIGGYDRERLVLKTDDEWNKLSKEQQKLLTHLNDMFRKWFMGDKAYLNQIGGEINGEAATHLQIFNFGKGDDTKIQYYEGWFPKLRKTTEELNYEEGARIRGQEVGQGDVPGANFIGRFSSNSIKTRIRNNLSRYNDITFEMYDDVRMALPLKYMDNMNVLNERSYTKNLVFMFDGFNKSMLHKSNMDQVYVLGEGLKQYLLLKKHANGQPMFENVIGFLEKSLIKDIQNRTRQYKWTQTPVSAGSYIDPLTGKKTKINVDIDKVILGMMNWTSVVTMWLKPIQGAGNGLHAKLLTYREGLKGSFASTFLHIDGDAIDFTLRDNIFADKIYFNSFLPDVMLGKMQQNKMWLLAQKLNYIPDNYDYATNRRFLLSTRNAIMDQSTMYLFHSKFEEWTSLTTMVAQLHHLKHPGNGKSLWDNYVVEVDPTTGLHEVVWKGGIRGYEQIGKGETTTKREITELTSHEIAKLKKVHERMQGGYRKEEAANGEIIVMGKAMIQFKKYLPRLIMNALGSKKEVVDLGYYKKMGETHKDPDTGKDLDIYEWTARMNEGRWRTLVNSILTIVNLSSEEYKWDALGTEQKQNIVDAILTLGMWSIFSGAYLALFYDDDDDDTYKKWWKNYLILNLSQQYNPLDLLHTLESASRPVSLARMYKMVESFTAMTVATGNLMFGDENKSFTSDGDLKGWNNFKRGIPYLASWEDFANKMKHGAPTEEWWTDKFEKNWR